jgi:hypothetical protein
MSVEQVLSHWAGQLGLPTDTLKTAIVLLGNYPLSYVFTRIPTAYKDLFSILVSSISFTVLFNPIGFLQILFLALVCYCVTLGTRKHSWGPILVFVIAMGTLLAK